MFIKNVIFVHSFAITAPQLLSILLNFLKNPQKRRFLWYDVKHHKEMKP